MTMKYFLILLLGISLCAAQETEKPLKAYLGAGPYFQTQPYEDASMQTVASPVIFFDNSLIYIRWTRVGFYFLGQSSEELSWGFSLTAQPRPYNYESTDADILADMDDRKTSWEGGISFAASNAYGYIELLVAKDLLHNSDGMVSTLEIGKKIKSGSWTFVPAASVIHYDSAFNDYYYGVTQDEENLLIGRPAYQAKSGINFAVQSYIMYDVADQWHLFGNLRADYHDDAVTNSPIVDQQMMYSGLISLLYSFEL